MPPEAQESDAQLVALRKVDVALAIALSVVTIYYLVDTMVDETDKAIWKARALAWWQSKFPCCDDCAEQRRQERRAVWEAIAIVEDLPL